MDKKNNTEINHKNDSNVWLKRILAIVGVAYTVLVLWFSYLVFFYEITIDNKISFCVAFSLISLLVLAAMIFTRHQILTRVASLILLPAAFPFIMITFGEWEIILPIIITALIIFFFSGTGEKTKTIFGVIYLLLYVLGSLAFFMLMAFFSTSEKQTILESGVSPSSLYRYEVIQSEDSSGGDIEVHVAPNDRDITLPLITFTALGYDRTVYLERPIPEEGTSDLTVTWETQSRESITQELLTISDDVSLDLRDEQRELLGISDVIDTVYLRTMTDSQLELLGIPEDNDVLIFDGKVCFRTYTAVLEDYFNPSNREITLLN